MQFLVESKICTAAAFEAEFGAVNSSKTNEILRCNQLKRIQMQTLQLPLLISTGHLELNSHLSVGHPQCDVKFVKHVFVEYLKIKQSTLNIHLVLKGLQGGHNFYCKQSMNQGHHLPQGPGQLSEYGTRREHLVEQQARFVCVPRFLKESL